jgi:uncharacterized membrane protein
MNGTSSRTRVMIALGVGLVIGGAVGFVSVWQLAVLVGWSAASAFWLLQVWFRVRNLDPEDTRRLATREDNSRTSASVLLVTACVASLVGAAFGLLKSHEVGTTPRCCSPRRGSTVILASRGAHRVHAALRARVLHRTRAASTSRAAFSPDYRDFAYVAFTVGMTFQVSTPTSTAG